VPIRASYNGQQIGREFQGLVSKKYVGRVRVAARGATFETADAIEHEGRADIRSAGRFGRRWTDGFHAQVSVVGSGSFSIRVFDDVPYFNIFEYGGIIRGRPLLWIPLSFARDAIGVRARDFPGGLFRVNRKRGGAPLLLSIRDRQPKYFGKSQVRIPKKFHIRRIVREQVARVGDRFRRLLSDGR
jgi:hypothetical protein